MVVSHSVYSKLLRIKMIIVRKQTAPTNRPYVLSQSGASSSVTGTTTETTLATITIPGGSMGPNGSLRISPLWSYTNSANTKTLRIKFAGNTCYSSTPTTSAGLQAYFTIRNNNSASAQSAIGTGTSSGSGGSSTAVVSLTVDTSLDQVVVITGQLASAAENISLLGYSVEVIPG
jgi:hypothetical protein